MIDLSLLCLVQRKKIVVFVVLIAIAIFSEFFVHVTVVAKNALLMSQTRSKRDGIGVQKNKELKIDKVLKMIKDADVAWISDRKSGIYNVFNKNEFLLALLLKMNGGEEPLNIERRDASDINDEYSDFTASVVPFAESEIDNNIKKTLQLLRVADDQRINVSFDANLLKISFKANYEYVAYRMLEMLKEVLPGHFVVKTFNIQPLSENNRQLLYNMRFYPEYNASSSENRLDCDIELVWFFLSSSMTERMVEKK